MLEKGLIPGSIILLMFNEPPKSDFERKREQEERERKIMQEKLLRDDVAKKPEFVAEELFRKYKWANRQASLMETKMLECRKEDYLHEKAEMYERWMLRYLTIEVQALAGLAAVSPEIRQRLSKE